MRTQNLAIVLIDIVGYTPRTAAQTREENQHMLERFDAVVRPMVRAFHGRIVKTMGDAFMLTFPSPTDALLCSMAVHDRMAQNNGEHPDDEPIQIRAAVNVGEVRQEKGDIFGEAVNIAARIEGHTEPGEIYFSEAVYLSMTKSEVPSEEVGYAELKGVADKVRLYRVPRAVEGKGYALKKIDAAAQAIDKTEGHPLSPVALPFAGVGLHRARSSDATDLTTQTRDVLGNIPDTARRLSDRLRELFHLWKRDVRTSRPMQIGTAVVAALLIGLLIWGVMPEKKPLTPWQKLQKRLGGND